MLLWKSRTFWTSFSHLNLTTTVLTTVCSTMRKQHIAHVLDKTLNSSIFQTLVALLTTSEFSQKRNTNPRLAFYSFSLSLTLHISIPPSLALPLSRRFTLKTMQIFSIHCSCFMYNICVIVWGINIVYNLPENDVKLIHSVLEYENAYVLDCPSVVFEFPPPAYSTNSNNINISWILRLTHPILSCVWY